MIPNSTPWRAVLCMSILLQMVSLKASASEHYETIWWTVEEHSLDRSYSCVSEVLPPIYPTANSDCAEAPTVVLHRTEVIKKDCTQNYTVVNEYLASDSCGNTSELFQVTTDIIDDQGPIWKSEIGSLNTSHGCMDVIEVQLLPEAYDVCGGSVEVQLASFDIVREGCGNNYSFRYAYVAIDLCGNESIPFYVDASVVDNTAPEWVTQEFALDTEHSCLNDLDISMQPTAVDECSGSIDVLLLNTDSKKLNCGENYDITMTYQAVDDCGNKSEKYIRTIRIRNNAELKWDTRSGELDQKVSCITEVNFTREPQISTQCNRDVQVQLRGTDVISQECENKLLLQMTYVAVDDCGIESEPLYVHYNIDDQSQPEWTTPIGDLDMVVESKDDLVFEKMPRATDHCGNVTSVTKINEEIIGSHCDEYIQYRRTYEAMDACQNRSIPYESVVMLKNPSLQVSWEVENQHLAFECGEVIDDPEFPVAYDGTGKRLKTELIDQTESRVDCKGGTKMQYEYVTYTDCGSASETIMLTRNINADNTAPTARVPDNIILTCFDDVNNLELTGKVLNAIDNCSRDVDISYTDEILIGGCAENGVILREWIIKDDCNNVMRETQHITVTPTDVLGEEDIRWPQDQIFDSCNEFYTRNTESPSILKNTCADIDIQFFDVEMDSCFQMQRIWVVTDKCQFDNSKGSSGRWRYIQNIESRSLADLNFSDSCSDENYCIRTNSCERQITLFNQFDLSVQDGLFLTYALDKDNDGITDQVGSGSFITTTLGIGQHLMRWFLKDDVGNEESCTELITVTDCKPPSLVCTNIAVTLSQMIMDDGETTIMTEVWASDVAVHASDNCTLSEDLKFSFSPVKDSIGVVFTCDDIGEQRIDIWITDEAGNQNRCRVKVRVEDNQELCGQSLISDGVSETRMETKVAQVLSSHNETEEIITFHSSMPNPFSNSTSITFGLTEKTKVQLSIMDSSGRLIYQQEKDCERGKREFKINREDLKGSTGVLYYRLVANQSTYYNSMVVIE